MDPKSRADHERLEALSAQLDVAEARMRQIEQDTMRAWNEHQKTCPEVTTIVNDQLAQENARLRKALRGLLLSRDASWTGGHDWEEAVQAAVQVLEET